MASGPASELPARSDTMTFLRAFADLAGSARTTPARHRAAVVLLAAGAVSISFGGLIVRGLEDATAWQFNAVRGVVGGVALLLVLAVRHRGMVAAHFRRMESPAWFGAGCLGLAALFYILSLTHTTVANTHFAMSAAPFMTAGLAWLVLRERLRRTTILAMAVAFGGIVIMVADGLAAGRSAGDWYALMAVLLFSTYGVIARGMRDANLLPAIIVAAFITMAGGIVGSLGDLHIGMHDILLGALWGLLVGLGGDWCFLTGVRHVTGAESMLLMMMIPSMLGPLWVWIVIGEAPSLTTLVGGVLILAALAGWAIRDLRA